MVKENPAARIPREPQAAVEPQAAAALRHISKIYPGGKPANRNVSLDLRRGEILCLAGENGAGKTTLMKILYGLEAPDSGEIWIRGRRVQIDSPRRANRLGIGMVHQHFMLFPEYTVAENIVLGIEPRRWGIFFDRAGAESAADAVIRAHDFSIDAARPVSSLTVGEMQQVEICKMLYRKVDIFILDEPTAVLTEQEIGSLFSTLKNLAAAGKAVFLITHKLEEIKAVSDRVAVLRKGEIAGIRNTAETGEGEISHLMVGGDFTYAPGTGRRGGNAAPSDNPIIVFEKVTALRRGQAQPLLKELSFSVRQGEILGFAGVSGNGLGVLEAVLGGFIHPASGRVFHRGRDISRLNIRRLRNQGLAFVPADRLRVGSAPALTVEENLAVDRRGEFTRFGLLDRRSIRAFASDLIRRYGIAGGSGDPVSSLSGGNIQKVILAREIDQFRDYIVFSEPTWGLDIAAAAFVYGEIAKLRDRGAAVILISTNLEDILNCADRIMVMYRGSIAAEFGNFEDTTRLREELGACMLGAERRLDRGVG
ncbi:MAG: ABC transporter ATP-binding protein [Treponema sp.]|jgi:simple sugar transport system ATP-binding protein|nr:ABC transporter ATP-binding protein [Treponema sp.]